MNSRDRSFVERIRRYSSTSSIEYRTLEILEREFKVIKERSRKSAMKQAARIARQFIWESHAPDVGNLCRVNECDYQCVAAKRIAETLDHYIK